MRIGLITMLAGKLPEREPSSAVLFPTYGVQLSFEDIDLVRIVSLAFKMALIQSVRIKYIKRLALNIM